MLVSVIIPTLERPKLLLRAVGSVLRQTHRELEVIVVVDRPDPKTASAVQSVEDARVRLVLNPHPSTAAAARNAGADHASGEWLAFLDDDDEWLPNKLERQLAFASVRRPALVSCLSRIVTPTATYTWPQVIYDNSSPIDEYLFDRRALFRGTGMIQSSSFLLPRWLFDKVRFNVESAHDDWEFVLRLSKQAGARIETYRRYWSFCTLKSSGQPIPRGHGPGPVLLNGWRAYDRFSRGAPLAVFVSASSDLARLKRGVTRRFRSSFIERSDTARPEGGTSCVF